jgi:hypothetical protein
VPNDIHPAKFVAVGLEHPAVDCDVHDAVVPAVNMSSVWPCLLSPPEI